MFKSYALASICAISAASQEFRFLQATDFKPVNADSQDSVYEFWADSMSSNYPNYTWEAHEAISDDGYISTLFHLTGVKSDPDIIPERQPVLLV